MKFFLKNPKQKTKFQISIIIISLFSVLGIISFRSNKKVIYMNIQEEIINRIPIFSSFSNIVNEDMSTNNNFNFNSKVSFFTNKILNIENINSTIRTINNRKDLPTLHIKIPFDNYEIILKERSNAINNRVLSNSTWVNGNIYSDKKILNAKFKLKGKLEDHWLANKKLSLKIELKNKQNILGMNSFYIHKLGSRQYPFENIFQEVISEIGFPSIQHNLVKINMNNNYWGIMDMQDNFSNEMMSKNKLVESLIVEFSDDKAFNWSRYKKDTQNLYVNKDWLYHPRIFFNLVSKDLDKLTSQEKLRYEYIGNMLKNKDYQNILFDNLKLSQMQELLSIWGSFHSAGFNNTVYYFNPFTLKLEPLMSDQDQIRFINDDRNNNSIKKITHGFLEPNTLTISERINIYKKTLNAIKRRKPYLLSRKYFPLDNEINEDKVERNYRFLKNSNLKFRNNEELFNLFKFKNTQKCELETLIKIPSQFSLLHASYNKNEILVTPLLCGKIFIEEIKLCNKIVDKNILIDQSEISISNPIKLPINNNLTSKFLDESGCKNYQNKIKYKYNGKKYLNEISYLPKLNKSVNPLLIKSLPKFIKKNRTGDLVINKGIWEVKEPIVIEGNLVINKDVILKFNPDTYLIVKGNLYIKGSKGNPVVMKPLKSSESWKGLYVYNENFKESNLSSVNYLQIYNTERTNIGVLNLTGGTTFYNANLKMNNIKIYNSKAEDSINIIKSNVDIENISLFNSASDGLDCDFCNGSISNINMENIGGDGVDFSGSDLNVYIKSANKIKDKVASIGEETNISIKIENVSNSFTAAAIKDGSKANIVLENINTNGPYIMAYDKKGFYKKNTFANVRYDYDKFKSEIFKYVRSSDVYLKVNDLNIPPSEIDVQALYKSGPMKK